MQLNSEEKEPYLVCLDPESGQIYTLGILSYNVHIEKDIPAKIKNKAKEALKRLADLRDLPGIKWWFKSEAVQMYRRRRLPIYLIQEDCPRYPTYEAHSNLSLAFKQVDTIEVHVSLVEYQGAMKDQGKRFNGEIRLNAALVGGADEVIKNVLRQLYKDYQIKLKPNHEKYKFVLKVSGLKEYFMGSVPMLAYETIRARLRGLKFIEVILSEISAAVTCETFPPTVERFKDEIKEGYYAPVDWAKYEETPFFIWYPPKELPRQKQLTEDRFDSKENNVFGIFKPGSIPIVKPLINTPAFDFRQKEFIRENEIAQLRKNCIYSGEMDLSFRLRVCGIDNLEVILSQFDQGATDNGLIEPNYITKSFARKDDGHGVHGQKKKKDRARDGFRVPKLVNYKKQEPPNLYLHHNDHGANSHLFVKLVKAGEFQILPYMITVEVALLYGCNVLIKEASVVTKPAAFSFSPRWNEWLTFGGLVLSQLPKELRICFNIKIHSPKGESHIIAATSHTLFDFHGRMKDGLIHLNLWPFYKTDPRFICTGGFWFLREKVLQPKPEDVDKFKATQFARLLIQLDTFRLPLFWSLRDSHKMPALSNKESLLKKTTSTYELAQLKSLLNRDPLNWQFDEIQRELLIKCRYNYKNTSSFLPIFLLAIDWSNPEEIAEAHLMLKVWEPMAPEEALTLLDARFPDSDVRLYAVQRISEFSDDDLALYLLELVQALIYEDQHWSPLGEFLLERSLANPHMIGHQFFWLLRSQLHFKPSFERFTILLEQFLMLCGSFIKDLENEMLANQMIADIAEEAPRMEANVRQIKTADKISELKQKGLPDEFSIPIDPRMRGVNFVADECKILNSKKLPLLLSIENMQPDAKNIKIIFKTGDDLRQDLLTIQLIKIMDKIWLDNGLDLRMKPYRVQSTADQAGMIELVLDSENLSDIHQTYGGGALGALDRTTITKFLGKWNKPESMESAKENFIRSSAGYAVATYILGIGDRHSGNIMLTKSGHLFHIDFGHFLGHFKKKLGINRERTPFVFTKEMAFVMGVNNFKDFKKALESPDFAKFVNFSTQAYNLVRNNGNLLISLFIMMLSAGMPELEGFADIEYLMNQLSLDLSELEATNKFINEIQRSLEDTFRVLDNLFHAIKRKTESDSPKKKNKDKE